MNIVRLDHPDGSKPAPALIWEIGDGYHDYVQCTKEWSKVRLGQPLPRYQATTTPGIEKSAGAHIPAVCYPQRMRTRPAAATASRAPEYEGRPSGQFGAQVPQYNYASSQAATNTRQGMSTSDPGQHANDPLRRTGISLSTNQHQAKPQGQASCQHGT